MLEAGGVISQETRRWDDAKGQNFLLRSKEDAHDYRYFPEPDLPAIVLEEAYVEDLKKQIPELPNKKIARYMKDYGLNQGDATLLVEQREKSVLFEQTLACGNVLPKNVSNWILVDLSKFMNETKKSIADRMMNEQNRGIDELGLNPAGIAEIIALIEANKISSSAGKQVFEEMLKTGKSPAEIVREKGLEQVSDTSALQAIVDEILANNQKSVDDYRNGKTNALGFLVGQCMKASKGKGNPALLKEMLLKFLEG